MAIASMLPAAPVPASLAEATVHTLDKFVFQISPGVGPRWYGTAYLMGFLVAWAIMRWLAKSGRIPMTPRMVGDFMTNAVIGVIVGGRVGHCLFYDQHLLVQFSGDFPFWGLLEIHKGGMSSHGGVIGVALAVVLYARRHKVPILALGDAACFVAPWGLMFGRLANWVNGELWGRPLPAEMQASAPWWSVKYPEEITLFVDLPKSLDPLRELVPASVKLESAAANGGTMSDNAFAQWLYATAYDHASPAHDAVVRGIEPVLTAYYPSQFFQAAAEGPALLLLMTLAWLAPRRAGVVTGVFFAGYGVLRYTTEQFREPDSAVIALGFLTLPMLLSMTMVGVGAMFIALSRRSQPIGGLLRRSAAGVPR